jgi:hypothetical protein
MDLGGIMKKKSYTFKDLNLAVEECIKKLQNARKRKRAEEFDPKAFLAEIARKKNIPENEREKFVQEAKGLFEMEVLLRGLGELKGWRQPLFSPVYTLYPYRRRKGEEE